MRPNIGKTDRVLRFVLGGVFILLAIYLRSGMLLLAGLFALYEAFSSWCVFYHVIGKNTCPLPSMHTQYIPTVRSFVRGLIVLFVAIIVNLIASYIGITTWYEILTKWKLPDSVDGYIFVLVAYPLILGFVAESTQSILAKK